MIATAGHIRRVDGIIVVVKVDHTHSSATIIINRITPRAGYLREGISVVVIGIGSCSIHSRHLLRKEGTYCNVILGHLVSF